jgi:pentatricopeptide repeat protein
MTEKVLDIFAEISDPTIEIYNTVLETTKQTKHQSTLLQKVLQRIKADNIRRQQSGKSEVAFDARTYTLLVDSYAKQGNITAMENVLSELERRPDLRPHTMLYVTVVNAYQNAGQKEKSEKYQRKVEELSATPNIRMFSKRLDAAAKKVCHLLFANVLSVVLLAHVGICGRNASNSSRNF